jgi:hypothetical protein
MDADEKLLEEYKLCQDRAEKIESRIWKTSGVIGIGSLGGLLALAGKGPDLVAGISGAVLIFATWIWWGMANRWWDLQQIIFSRMRCIELDLNIYPTRYIRFLDLISEAKEIRESAGKLSIGVQKKFDVAKRKIRKVQSEKISSSVKKYLFERHYPINTKGVKGWL